MAESKVNFGSMRYYEKEVPEVHDLVMVKIAQVNETSAYVQLLEYGNMEGMIPYTELSRRRIRSIAKLVKVGKLEVAQVLRLDRNKGYIDLSKKAVTAEERSQCEDRFNKAKFVHSIMGNCASQTGVSFDEIHKTVTWPLYKKYGHAHDALRMAVHKPDEVFEGLDVKPEVLDHLLKTIKLKLKPQPLKLRADLNVTCYKRAGIDAIKEVLKIGINEGQNEPKMDVTVTIDAPPLYSIRTQTEDPKEGIDKLKNIIKVMEAAMAERQGAIEVVQHPRIVNDKGNDIRTADMNDSETESSDDEEDSEDDE